jgi:hypothetical protein
LSNSTSSIASDVLTIQSSLNGENGLIAVVAATSSTVSSVSQQYGVTLNANGAVSGFQILNGSAGASSFIIDSGSFLIYTGTNHSGLPAFSVSGSTIQLNENVVILGSVSANSLNVGTSPAISGHTMTGDGAYVGTTGHFALGNSTGNLVYDGTTLYLNGTLVDTGNIISNAVTNFQSIELISYVQYATTATIFTMDHAGTCSAIALVTTGYNELSDSVNDFKFALSYDTDTVGPNSFVKGQTGNGVFPAQVILMATTSTTAGNHTINVYTSSTFSDGTFNDYYISIYLFRSYR